jgi:hypothetical protein
MKRRLPQYALAFSFALALASGASAQTLVDRAREGEVRQGQIQAESQNLVGQLDAMLDEYQRNALSGEEIKTFQSLRALLSRLTDQEMAKIRAVLQNGAAKNDPQVAIKAIADAYAAQKGVLGEFKRVLAEHEHNQEALRLSREVNALADRQAAVLQTGIEAAQFSLTNRGAKAATEASLTAQAAEQKAISDDLKLMREKIEGFSKNEENKDAAPRFSKGLEQAAKVAPKLQAAAQALENKQVFNAVTAQKAARDEMREMARTIAPPKDEAETLRHAAEQVDKLLAQQKEAIAMAQSGKPQTMPDWVAEQLQDPKSAVSRLAAARKQFDPEKLAKERALEWPYKNRMSEKESNLAGLENRQGDLANQTDALSQEVAGVAKPVAEALQAAIPKMQEARAAANAKQPEPAAKAMLQAMAAMEKAKADLGQRLAAVEQVKGAPGDAVANLENLQKQTQELMKQQQALAQKPAGPPAAAPAAAKAAQQAALQQQAQQLQKQAAAAAPAAAPALAKAAANMQQAAAAMNNPAQAAAVAPAQQQAVQNLAQANQQVAQQLAQAQGAQAAAAAQQQALTALAKVVIDQQLLELETVTAPAKPDTARAVLLALAPRQESVRVAADELKNPGAAGAAPAPPVDPKILKSATGHMVSAKSALGKADGKAADPEELLALKDLYALQDTALAQLAAAQANQRAAAQAPAAAAAAANQAAALAQAQAQVAQAAAALAAANPPAGAPPAGAPPVGAPPAGGAPPAAAMAGAPAPGQPAPGAPAAGAPPAGALAGAPAPGAPAAGAPAAGQPGAPAPGGAPGPAMAKAAGQLGGAASAVGAAAAQPGAAPQAAKDAMRQAAAALTNAAGQAAANNGAAAQAATADAQQALTQAQAALAQAQAGLSPAGGPPAPGAPGGQPGQPAPGGPPGAPSTGGNGEGAWAPGGALTAQAGGTVSGKGQFVGLPERDRATIRQAQSEKYPQQYAAEVEQYLRNLSDESTPR